MPEQSLIIDAFAGMDNINRSEALIKKGLLRLVVNTDIDDHGIARLRPGQTKIYTGTAPHSLWHNEHDDVYYFVDVGDLYELKEESGTYTWRIIKNGVGDNPMSYTQVGASTYYSNALVTGQLVGGVFRLWGLPTPAHQPHALAISAGDMYGGRYRVAVTWLDRYGNESGTGKAAEVIVPDGGGIRVEDFPVNPADIISMRLYVTSVNGRKLYRYAELPVNVGLYSIRNKDVAIRLETQFCYAPPPSELIYAHYGHIYFGMGHKLKFTNAFKYGLTKDMNFRQFDSAITMIAGIPGVLYVGTKNKTFRMITDPEGAVIREESAPYGAVPGSLSFDLNHEKAFWMSNRGYVEADIEGVREIHNDRAATPRFKSGTTTIIEDDGIKKLIGVFRGGVASNLAAKTG